MALQPRQSQGIWIDFQVPADARPGNYLGSTTLMSDGKPAAEFQLLLRVLPATLPPPSAYHCYLNVLVDPSSIARFNKLPLWGEEHWRQLREYVQDLAVHGQKRLQRSLWRILGTR